MSAQQQIGKFVKPLLRRLGINVDGSSASALRLLGQLSWPTGLGAITHIQGPSDQDLQIVPPSGRVLRLGAAGSVRWLVQAGSLIPLTNGTYDLGTASNRVGQIYAAGGTVPSVLHKSVTSASTGANTDETTLWSYSLPAGTLASDGQAVRITVFGETASNTNTKTVTLKFGATTLGARTTTTSGATWQAVATVMRSGATAQVATAQSHITSGIVQNTTAPAETLANAVTIALTGTNGTASDGDITFKGAIVEFLP